MYKIVHFYITFFVHSYIIINIISRLIVHIPDKNFKQIRFYGAYHNSTKISINVVNFLTEEKAKFIKTLNTWKSMIVLSFSINPLNCPICNSFMGVNGKIKCRNSVKNFVGFPTFFIC